MKTVSWHLHGYQPGDILYRIDNDPRKPIKFQERHSEVSIYIDDIRYDGRNWTDLMLRLYEKFNHVLKDLSSINAGISVDIEAQTLDLLALKYPKTFHTLLCYFNDSNFVFLMTYPYHPIVPHLPRDIQKDLTKIMFSFYRPLTEDELIGVWFPEGVMTTGSLNILEEISRKESKRAFVVGDDMQVSVGSKLYLFSCNLIDKTNIIGHFRDRELSDAFSFSLLSVNELAERIAHITDPAKDSRGITYLHLLSTDLETLFYGKDKNKQFISLIRELVKRNIKVVNVKDFIQEKLTCRSSLGECLRWKVSLIDYSSWSGYTDIDNGLSLDSRWLGVRRTDFKAFSREVFGRKISQVWKYALMILQNRILSTIRSLLVQLGLEEYIPRYLYFAFPSYTKTVLGEKYLSKDMVLGGYQGEDLVALYALRSYYEALMASKSCPRFWEVMDTRVTFQAGSLMASALNDAFRVSYTMDYKKMQHEILGLLEELLNFYELYYSYGIYVLNSVEGWEASRKAWDHCLNFAIGLKDIKGINALSRGAYYALAHEKELLFDVSFPDDVTCDVGYIPSEYIIGSWRCCEDV
ncbi:MAG: hypothetical protein DRN30_04425 [Thermoplasmata archaeon]|nr:MAG: hypothetical protein DRN30_04425 [Thermoplasmata archaeon]